jgi:cyclopropane-fatty-acyl-phospholipid synthase
MRKKAGQQLRDRVLAYLGHQLGAGVPLRLVLWDGSATDFAPAPQVTVTVRRRQLVRAFLAGDMSRLGQAYVAGDIEVEGRLQDVLHTGIAIAELIGRSPLLGRLAGLLPRRWHSRSRDMTDVRHHYDVSNEFYRLWLDQRMIYSCAYFASGEEDIDTAQQQKLEHLCRKLRLAPGERLLDIGCGWGGLVCWAAAQYGVEAVGVTLSEKQVAEARSRVEAQGLAGRVEIRCQDYRDLEGAEIFDKIVSVGMYEHVGLANLPLYFGTVARLLKPGGTALNHGITNADRDAHTKGPPGGDFIDRFVFPGGELPHLSRVLYDIAGAGLEVVDVEDLRPHYPPTLLHWLARLEANREAALAEAGSERYRIWRLYLAGMAHAFDQGWLSLAQVLAVKPDAGGPAARPWTRRYQYAPEATPALSRSPDWGEL